jgi:hypothetical protein
MEPELGERGKEPNTSNAAYWGVGLFCGLPLMLVLCGAGLFAGLLIVERMGISLAALFPAESNNGPATILAAALVVLCWAGLFAGSAALVGWIGMRRKPPADGPAPKT